MAGPHRNYLIRCNTDATVRWPLMRIFCIIFILLCRLELLHGFDRKGGSARSQGSRYNYSSILDDAVKGYSDHHKNITARINGRTRGLFRNLWARGRERSVSMVEGVRASYELRGGGGGDDSSSLDATARLPSVDDDVDMLGRSFVVLLAWIVALQATFAGLVSHRRSLAEVRGRFL
jgi:hypothetical protein